MKTFLYPFFRFMYKHHPLLFLPEYQDECRFYLDEVEGQEELRKEWFDTIVYQHNYELDEIANNYCYFESDQIFANRWMKRN